MSSKLLILAALLVIPFSAHAQLESTKEGAYGEELKLQQICPSADVTVCREFHKILTEHVGKRDFNKVKHQLRKQIANMEKFQQNYGPAFDDQADAKNADNRFLSNEGIAGNGQREQIKAHIQMLIINANIDGVPAEAQANMQLRIERLERILDERFGAKGASSSQGSSAKGLR